MRRRSVPATVATSNSDYVAQTQTHNPVLYRPLGILAVPLRRILSIDSMRFLKSTDDLRPVAG